MRITKKITTNNNQQWKTKQIAVQQDTKGTSKPSYQIDTQAIIPVGKFQGHTVQYLMDNEQWYWNWVLNNNLVEKWELTKTGEPKKTKVYVNDEGVRYLYMTFHPITNGKPSQWLD